MASKTLQLVGHANLSAASIKQYNSLRISLSSPDLTAGYSGEHILDRSAMQHSKYNI
jgi:hypothetical protein